MSTSLFQRRHYEALAKSVVDATKPIDGEVAAIWAARVSTMREASGVLADLLAKDNPRFDRSRFLIACGFTR